MGNGIDRAGWRRRLGAVACLWTFAFATPSLAADCGPDHVTLRGDWGTVRFNVEIADDPFEQSRGLMNRETLAYSSGMLFVYDRPKPVSFWMRNTLIPLDMLFINKHGVVGHIHHNAIPLDETSIFGGDQVFAVLEINGGLAGKLGITDGTVLRHPAFSAHLPAWPC